MTASPIEDNTSPEHRIWELRLDKAGEALMLNRTKLIERCLKRELEFVLDQEVAEIKRPNEEIRKKYES